MWRGKLPTGPSLVIDILVIKCSFSLLFIFLIIIVHFLSMFTFFVKVFIQIWCVGMFSIKGKKE